MNIKNSVLDYIKYKQLNWYFQVKRMDEERLPQKILQQCLPGRRRRRRRKGRPRNSWMQEVTTGRREKGINNMEWVDREEWRIKIKLKLQAKEDVCVHIETLYINK